MQAYDLQGFEDYLKENRIVPERNRPWCVRWVERFLKSPACQRGDLCEEGRVRQFVEQLGSDRRWKD